VPSVAVAAVAANPAALAVALNAAVVVFHANA
jgi:hypothetical protein